jgi:hypothetical protein
VESALRSFATLHPDNPITQTGVLSELSHHGVSSRLGRRRADVGHHFIDPVIVGAPWVAGGVAAYKVGKRLLRRQPG